MSGAGKLDEILAASGSLFGRVEEQNPENSACNCRTTTRAPRPPAAVRGLPARRRLRRRSHRGRSRWPISTTSSSIGTTAAISSSARPSNPSQPEFPSMAAEVPALNWQEREIQDWFGIEAVGHPNPRRVALHDNWPEVHPLRKDFPVDTVLATVRRRTARLPPDTRRRRVPDSGRAGARGDHRARAFQFRGGRRADPVPAAPDVLHAQRNREALRAAPGASRRLPGGERFRRLRFFARDRVLPGPGTNRRRRGSGSRQGHAHHSAGAGTAVQPRRGHRDDRDRCRIRHRQRPRFAAAREHPVPERGADRKPPAARSGLPGRSYAERSIARASGRRWTTWPASSRASTVLWT